MEWSLFKEGVPRQICFASAFDGDDMDSNHSCSEFLSAPDFGTKDLINESLEKELSILKCWNVIVTRF